MLRSAEQGYVPAQTGMGEILISGRRNGAIPNSWAQLEYGCREEERTYCCNRRNVNRVEPRSTKIFDFPVPIRSGDRLDCRVGGGALAR